MTLDVMFNQGSTKCYTRSLSQHDRGVRLRFFGIALPKRFEVHFSNSEEDGVAGVVIGNNYTVVVPDSYLATGSYVYAWVFSYGTTKTLAYDVEDEILSVEPTEVFNDDPRKANSICEVVIPIARRPMPLILPVEGSEIDLSDDETLNFSFSEDNESLIIGRN